jgi:negative regulator of sigma E activity
MATNNRKEKISAFLDNEIHRDEIMSFSLSSEDEDAEVIRRYQMMGEVLRGEVSESSFIDVSQAVHQALVDEDLVIEQKPASSRPVNDTPATGFAFSSWFRPAAGMAVAASVALVMVVTLSGEENSAPVPLAKNIEPQPVAVEPVQLAVEYQPANKEATYIAPHLVDHHLEFATQDTFQGRLPYVRAVSYQKKAQ